MVVGFEIISFSFLARFYKGVSITRCRLRLLAGAMATVEAEEGGPQLIETLPNASSMPPSNAAAESGAADARDEEEDDGAGAADGTQRNDATWMTIPSA